ncbi:ATP-binding protein [Photobacterium sp.]|uniref:ATP-binding protein n=1 Tax=Photobacterium sp. TaxID=660 RepID=UPI00299CF6CD|nr:ATP-binding protein [Photobacterium sp.]MDX1301221.1 ATP-binding protein [Photobacterium sp.]
MKPIVAPVKNLIAAQVAFETVVRRPYGIPGICLMHGESGLGKTTANAYIYSQVDGIYVSARAHDSTSSLMMRVVEELGSTPAYRISKNIDFIIEQISMNERPLFIDEADYLMNDVRMLDTIRDIYDGAETPIILIGMDQIARRISKRKQFFNRISEWVEFKRADLDDITTMANSLLEDNILVEEELLEHLRKSTSGEMRRIIIGLTKIETLAKANDIELVTRQDWGNQPFHGLRD